MKLTIRGQTASTETERIELGGELSSRHGFRIIRFEVLPEDFTANAYALGNLVRGDAISPILPNFGENREVAWAGCFVNFDAVVGISQSEWSRIDRNLVLLQLCHVSVEELVAGGRVNWLLELERVELSAGELAYWNQRAGSIRV